MVIINFQVFILSNVNVYGLVSVSPPSTSTFDRTLQYFLCRLWYSKIDREISSTMCHMSLQYISQYIVLEMLIPMIYNMPYLATRPGVRREPGIFGRKLSVGATLDIGR